MKQILLCLMLVALTLIGCSGKSTVGDGKVDAIESASIAVLVGAYLNTHPELIGPTWAMSTAVIQTIEKDKISTVPLIDKVVEKELSKMKFDPLTKQSFNELVTLVKLKIAEQLPSKELPEAIKVVVVVDVLKVIQQTSAARLGI